MATWTHFTAFLNGSRPITKAERDEIYDNLHTLLTASGCSSAGYSLNNTDQAAIKASALLTDVASLNGPSSSNTKARLQTIFATASSAFSNYSAAVSTALSGEGLTSTQRDDIINSAADHYKLWNYFKRLIDALACGTPCTPPSLVGGGASYSGTVGTFFSASFSATGTTPFSYGASGLPPGLSVNPSTGAITGTPTTAGFFTVTISATNSCGTDSDSISITIASLPVECHGEPTLQCDSVAASMTKCGFTEHPDHLSTPPKFYLSREWFGSMRQLVWNSSGCGPGSADEVITTTFGGIRSFSFPGCVEGGTNTVNGVAADPSSGMAAFLSCADFECPTTVTNNAFGQLTTYPPDGVCHPGFPSFSYDTGGAGGSPPSEQLYNEFSTTLLTSHVAGQLSSYPNTWSGDCMAIRDLASDETSYSAQRFKYRFQLPSMAGITTATISWVERFTPASGGSPIDTPRTYNWDGSASVTGVYEVIEPSVNGTIEIVNVNMECT